MKKETRLRSTKRAASSSQSKNSPLTPTATRIRASRSSASATSKADILISIKPIYMNYIVQRTKNHEFRKYLISSAVQRMWLYVSSPDQTLRYIATIGHGKMPGEIELENGMGNADFNAGLMEAVAAYEIIELYQLKEPLTLMEMRRRYKVTFPQRFFYVSEKIIEDIALEDQIRLF